MQPLLDQAIVQVVAAQKLQALKTNGRYCLRHKFFAELILLYVARVIHVTEHPEDVAHVSLSFQFKLVSTGIDAI